MHLLTKWYNIKLDLYVKQYVNPSYPAQQPFRFCDNLSIVLRFLLDSTMLKKAIHDEFYLKISTMLKKAIYD